MSFIDQVKIYVKAGDGGKGCYSFYFNRRTGKRYPDGGDGGRGGDVIIKADASLWDLTHLKYQKHIRAEDGAHGKGNQKTGRCGRDAIVKVPVGTIVRDLDTNLLIRDLTQDGDEVIVAKGGKGGRGNAYTKAEPIPPQKGEERNLFLELKLLAEVGLVGFPNAGKTTLLNTMCKAKGKVASYPFTTLEPKLGVIWYKDTPIRIADIPGLIEEAHKGRGLGDQFLKHIQRTKLLLFILGLADTDPQPWEALKILREELKSYDEKLVRKPYLIVANKIDLSEAGEKFKILREKAKDEIHAISALKGRGIEELKERIIKFLMKNAG